MTAGASAKSPDIVLIVAVAENGVIGATNSIPWRLKADQQRFKAMTMDKPLIMGRKTFLSLRKPLPGRTNIVVTRDPNFSAEGAVVVTSLEQARSVAIEDALRRFATEIIVMGGADIYAQSMDSADRLEITEVHAKPEGDTFFAPVDTKAWEEVARERHTKAEGDTADYSYVTYRRRATN